MGQLKTRFKDPRSGPDQENSAPIGQPSPNEFAGCCFSPDGRVLFFNVQGARTADAAAGQPGATYAMWGPWEIGAI
jgi:secreted PhoX family phosphatase